MEAKVILIELLIVIILTGYTVYAIHEFMPKVEKCEPSFEIINNCSCIPDKYLAKLFNQDNYIDFRINNSEAQDE